MPAKRGTPGRARSDAQLVAPTPAPIGNQRRLEHGGWAAVAPERLEARVAELVALLGHDVPMKTADGRLPAADTVAVTLLAQQMLRLEDVREYLGRRGWQDKRGDPRKAVALEERLQASILRLLEQLGMTPAARAKLGVDIIRGLDLAQHWAGQEASGG